MICENWTDSAFETKSRVTIDGLNMFLVFFQFTCMHCMSLRKTDAWTYWSWLSTRTCWSELLSQCLFPFLDIFCTILNESNMTMKLQIFLPGFMPTPCSCTRQSVPMATTVRHMSWQIMLMRHNLCTASRANVSHAQPIYQEQIEVQCSSCNVHDRKYCIKGKC